VISSRLQSAHALALTTGALRARHTIQPATMIAAANAAASAALRIDAGR
jgi:hypothetical protein